MEIREIVQLLNDRAEDVAAMLLPGGKREGREWVVRPAVAFWYSGPRFPCRQDERHHQHFGESVYCPGSPQPGSRDHL